MFSHADNPKTEKKHQNIETFQWTYKVFAGSNFLHLFSSHLSCMLIAENNHCAFFNRPTTVLKLASKEETRTFSRQNEKLRAIKDLKMPMARFMNGILIGQAKQSIPLATASKCEAQWARLPLQYIRWSEA